MPRARGRTPSRANAPRLLEAGEVAWLVAIPSGLLVAALVMVLGPPLGDLLFPPLDVHFWTSQPNVFPEPTEDARYLLSLLAPVVASVAVVLAVRRGSWRESELTRGLVVVVQLVVLGVFLAALVRQLTPDFDPQIDEPYFSVVALAVAVAFAGGVCAVVADAGRRALVAGWLGETPGRSFACMAAALLFTLAWAVTAVNSDTSIGSSHWAVSGLVPWTLDDMYAVVNGRAPLVDFHSQYGSLSPYVVAVPMLVFGSSLTVPTTFMAAITALVLLAVYDVLRRVTRSSLGALLLYVPFVAIGFYRLIGPMHDRFAPSNTFSWFPIRTAGPFLLAWLVVRHLDGVRPRRVWPLFLVAGLTLINNIDLGLAAFGATIAALLWTRAGSSWRDLVRPALEAAAGVVGAVMVVTTLTLAVSGSLPHFGLLVEFSRLYGVGGWSLQPMPSFGFHAAVYLTYAAAVLLATVRALRGERDALTGMLAWSGIFGFGAAGYFVGQSRYLHLIFLFSAWGLALALLMVAVLRGMADRASHRPTAADVAVLVAFGLAVCAVAQTPRPWEEVSRLREAAHPSRWHGNLAERFVAAGTKPGERVVILLPLGHRIANDLGLVNVSPYSMMEAVPTSEQLERTVRVLREEGGRKLYYKITLPDQGFFLERAGFRMTRYGKATGFSEWSAVR